MAGQGVRFAGLSRAGLRAWQVGPKADAAGREGWSRLLRLREAAFGPGKDDPSDERSCQILVERDGGTGGALAGFRLMVLPGVGLQAGYSAAFYDLAPLMATPGPVVEPGRFALAPDLDPGLAADVMRLAWGAITAVVEESGALALMGCSSFPGVDPEPHRPALQLLAQAHLGPVGLRPGKRAAETVDLPEPTARPLTAEARRAGLAGLPPLLRSYLGMGAWVSDHAVIDRQLATLHVLTWLDVDRIPKARADSLRALARGQAGGPRS